MLTKTYDASVVAKQAKAMRSEYLSALLDNVLSIAVKFVKRSKNVIMAQIPHTA